MREGQRSEAPLERGIPVLGKAPKRSDENPRTMAAGATVPQQEAEIPSDASVTDAPLTLDAVLGCVQQHFPLLLAAYEEIAAAAGRTEAAAGGFDTLLFSKARLQLAGFYKSERYDLGFEQRTTLGGISLSGGYRRGKGDFDPTFDGRAQTDERGEFRVGVGIPLLQGRSIDPARILLWKARLGERQATPLIRQQQLAALLEAEVNYWKWVSAGRKVEIVQRLLSLAKQRQQQVQETVEEGLLAAVNLIENQRLIVERRANLAAADRVLQNAAIKLSLYWRDAAGAPLIAPSNRLPTDFPPPREPVAVLLEDDVQQARKRRPELERLRLAMEQLDLDRDLALNQRLLQANVDLFGSQDIGSASSQLDTKGPFEFGLGLNLRLPIQRRAARGKQREAEARLARLQHELHFARDTVSAEVQDAASGLSQSWLRYREGRENERLALELEQAEWERLNLGESDLFRVNLREQQTASASAAVVDAQTDYFLALADYRTSLGMLAPLDHVGR